MSVSNFIPRLWAAKVNQKLQKALVFADCCNRDYEGEIAQLGDSVRINGIGPVTVGDYVKNVTTVTPEELNDESQLLTISQSKYFAFKVDDVDKAQAKGNLLPAAMDDAAYRIRDAADSFIAGLYGGAGSTTEVTEIWVANAQAALLSLAQALDEANVPTEGRWCVIPPWFKTKLVQAKALVENTTNDAFDNGRIGRCAGFDLRQSNNVSNDGTTYRIMAGTTKAITFAEQLTEVEAYRPEGGFSDAVKGLSLYGAKVVYADALAVLQAQIGVEP